MIIHARIPISFLIDKPVINKTTNPINPNISKNSAFTILLTSALTDPISQGLVSIQGDILHILQVKRHYLLH